MATNNSQLEQLFRECDKNGTGHIGPSEFRELCTGFDIGPADSDAIFADLDHDGDGKVSLEDFAWGFRDFLRPDEGDARRASVDESAATRWQDMERRQSVARRAWSNLVASVGLSTITQFLNTSGPKLAELYEELQTLETCPQLVKHFEHAFSSLLHDVKKLHEDNKKMEEMFMKEKEVHLIHLRSLEEELDMQVARVEQQVREEARTKYEAEKRALQERMETEIAELQTHLRLFQKVNKALSRKTGENQPDERHEAAMENRQLRQMLADTKTNLALLRSEMAHLKTEYDFKCRLLNEQEETVSEYRQQNDLVHRQLDLLQYRNLSKVKEEIFEFLPSETEKGRSLQGPSPVIRERKIFTEANSRMQDTNDSLLSVLELPETRSPRPASPCCCSQASSTGSGPRTSISPSIRLWHTENEPPSDLSNTFDSPPNSLDHCTTLSKEDSQFSIKEFIEDLDSGRSTMRETHDADSDKSLHDELLLATGKLPDARVNIQASEKPISSPAPVTHYIPKISVTAAELEPTGPPDRTFKIVLAGDAAVGKSCFIFRFCKGVFHKNLGSTLGVDFQVKTIRVDNRNVTLQLWDTAGQERFRSMTKAYFRRADGVMLLYDVTNEKSFLNVRQWIQGIEEVTERAVPITLCGNKLDLRNESRAQGISCVDTSQGRKLAEENKAIFMETSSKTGDNILEAVLALSYEMLMQEDSEVKTSAMEIKSEPTKTCCASKK